MAILHSNRPPPGTRGRRSGHSSLYSQTSATGEAGPQGRIRDTTKQACMTNDGHVSPHIVQRNGSPVLDTSRDCVLVESRRMVSGRSARYGVMPAHGESLPSWRPLRERPGPSGDLAQLPMVSMPGSLKPEPGRSAANCSIASAAVPGPGIAPGGTTGS